MSELTGFLIVLAFIGGLVVGIIATITGYKMGFRASYEIRECKTQEDEGKGLLGYKEPAEFELLGEKT